jgi:hypothetical protein
MNLNHGEASVQASVTFHSDNYAPATANVVIMSDHIARLRDEGKIQRRGFFFTYTPEGAAIIDLATRRK